MALPALSLFHDQIDFGNSVLQQFNACPICHLPLIFSNDSSNTIRTLDSLWMGISSTFKQNIVQNSNLYGSYTAKKSNAEKCHYVSKTMIPEITRSFLYESPVIGGTMYPERIYYLNPDTRRLQNGKPFEYNFRTLIATLNIRRLNRAITMFNMTASQFFLGCRDCNAVHTAHHQVRHITIQHYNLQQPYTNTPSCVNMYSLIFDCMAEHDGGENRIVVDEWKAQTWLIQVWMYYCTIMFFAQNEAAQNRSKLHATYVAVPNVYYFHYAHRDVGLCDFYMSQLLCVSLYCNHDIEYNYMYLHQNFFARLPLWAKANQKFLTPIHSYNSLWRMVMGCDETVNQIFPVCTDLAWDLQATHYQTAADKYWLHNTRKIDICRKVTVFSNTWIKIIGDILTNFSTTQDIQVSKTYIDNRYPNDSMEIKSLLDFYYGNCVLNYNNSKRWIGCQTATNESYLTEIARRPTLTTTSTLLRQQGYSKHILYNYVKLSLARHKAVLYMTNELIDNPALSNERRLRNKYDKVVNYVQELISI